jgi:hypothetical protein
MNKDKHPRRHSCTHTHTRMRRQEATCTHAAFLVSWGKIKECILGDLGYGHKHGCIKVTEARVCIYLHICETHADFLILEGSQGEKKAHHDIILDTEVFFLVPGGCLCFGRWRFTIRWKLFFADWSVKWHV